MKDIDFYIKSSVYYSEKYDQVNALDFADLAVRCSPDNYKGYYQAAMVLCKMCEYDAALEFVDQSIKINPDYLKSILNRALILGGLGRYEEAIEQYIAILKIQPNYTEANFYLACALLATGRFSEGYEKYECRFSFDKVKEFVKLLPDIPMWNGEALINKRILLFCEQGIGDLIQYVRYAKNFNGHVSLLVPDSLISLIKKCDRIDEIIPFNYSKVANKNYDYICSVMSLPKFFGINKSEKYINYKLSSDKKHFNIGIAWAGNEGHESDHFRSCHSKYFSILQQVKNVKIYSLQMGNMKRCWVDDGEVDLLNGEEKLANFKDFNDTANLIKKLDLVISIDTAVAHISAAMGVPTWILLGFYPDHRWEVDKTDTHWYPSVKLFRQPNYSRDWESVLLNVKKELEKLSR